MHNGAVIRFVAAVVVLTLLVVSPSARGEDTAQPVPANGKCSVPADRQWTRQEKFVWQHVCVGDVADFNREPGYGGDLDPKRKEGLPDGRILRPVFLETILLADKYRHALTRRGVRIVGARFTDTVDLSNADLGHELWLDRSLLERDADFTGAKSTNVISIFGSKVVGALEMYGLQLDQDLSLRGEAEFSEIDLHQAHVRGQIALTGSKVTGTLDMDSLQVDHSLLMYDKGEFGAIDLHNAHVGGELALNGSKAIGTLNMEALRVDHDLLMYDKAEFGAIVLRDAHVGGQLALIGSKVTGSLDMDTAQVGLTVYLGRGAEFEGPVSLTFAKVGDIEFGGGSFRGDVDLTAAQLGAELLLGSSQDGSARWSANSALILRDANADAIQDLSNSWPDKLDLNGFTYRSLGGLLANEKDPMIDRPVGWFENWLGKQKPYTPAPYEQLATVLRNEGKPDVADDILYSAKEIERGQSASMRYIEMTANKWVIGYGYHKFWSIYWAAGFLVAGTVLLWLSGEGRRVSRHYSLPYGIFYSFDLLLPIVRLREKHYKVDLNGWIRYYFYVHRIMGYVLASFLIAGISGLTK